MAKTNTNKVETKEIEQPVATVTTDVKPVAKKRRNNRKKTVKQSVQEVKQDVVETVEDVKELIEEIKVEATEVPLTWKIKLEVFWLNIVARFRKLF